MRITRGFWRKKGHLSKAVASVWVVAVLQGNAAGGLTAMLWSAPVQTQTQVRTAVQTQAAGRPQTQAQTPPALEIPAPLAGKRERLIYHTGYTVSYNADWRLPNWVAYELTPEETSGTAKRADRFVPDPEVPFHETATTDDYKHSGYDRGHMAPAGDMKWSEAAMQESFYLSNICPQHPALNRGIWKRLEDLVRRQAATRGSVYVVCGPLAADTARRLGGGGSGDGGSGDQRGGQGVLVPHGFFKALLQYADGRWAAIAFTFDNGDAEAGGKATSGGQRANATDKGRSAKTAGTALSDHTLSIDSLEILTGFDFFPALPDSIETAVERETDPDWWGL